MKGKKLWNKLKNYLLEEQKYVPEIKEIEIYKKEVIDDISIYDVNGIPIKQSNKQLKLDKQQLNEVNDNDIDNTGSFYWPSEFILSKFLLDNMNILSNKKIIELGAGRSGFCGLVLAKKGYNVILTDGNESIINYLQENVQLNNVDVKVEVMKWQNGEFYENTIAIISDCFFFENYHDNLVQTLKRFKRTIGAAPSRGGSLERFIQKCQENQIKCTEISKIFDTFIILFEILQ